MPRRLNISSHEDWLRERNNGIGASEVGTILGLNPYDSPYALFLRKTGQLPSQEETLPMKLGHRMEPIIAQLYEEETGRVLHDPGEYTILQHSEHEWLRCTLDRVVYCEHSSEIPIELKTASLMLAKDWSPSSAPLAYEAQLQIQMCVMDVEYGEIAGLVGNTDFYIIPYERNDNFLNNIIPVLFEFWERVQNNDPPPTGASDATTKAIKLLHPLDNGETVRLQDHILQRWLELQNIKKGIEKEINGTENAIKESLGAATFGEAHDLRISYKAQTRRGGISVPLSERDNLIKAGIQFTETEPSTYRALRKAKS